MSIAQYATDLVKVSRFLKQARHLISDEVTVQKLDTLVHILLNPDGIPQQDLTEKAQLTRGAASKNVADLTAFTSKKQEGPNLVESTIDPMNRVSRTIRLTRNGEKQLLKALEQSFGKKGETK